MSGCEEINKKIYLDNCCFNRPYDDQSHIRIELEAKAKLHIQKLIGDGRFDLVTSYTLVYENEKNPHIDRRESISRFIEDNSSLHISGLKNEEIQSMVKEIMGTGIKTNDAYHIASAIFSKCDYLISTDDRLLKYKTDKIILLTPTEFVAKEG